jgi:hypothetical protein
LNSTPNLTSLFLFEILAVLALGSIFLFLAIYVVWENRSSERSRVAAKESFRHKEPHPLTDTGSLLALARPQARLAAPGYIIVT